MKYLLYVLKNRTILLLCIMIITILIFSMASPYFFTMYNITQILHFVTLVLLISIGQNLVILAGGGGIDLSIGSIISLSGVVMGLLYHAGVPINLAVVVTLLIGMLMGAVNGFNIAYIKMPPLIATLGTLYMYGGLALVLSGTGTISNFPQDFFWLGQYSILGIPVKIILLLVPIICIVLFIMKKTELGRNIYLIGINETAARYAGIEVLKIRFSMYVISSLLATIGGILMVSYLMTAKADVGKDLELQAIIIVMLGGTSIKGGIGKIENIIFSALIITILSTGLQLIQINTVWQMGILGIILLGTTILNNLLEK